MNIKQLVRDPEYVFSCILENADSYIAKKGIKLHIPVSLEEASLLSIGVETYILGIFALIVDDKYYAVHNAPTMFRVEPTTVNKIEIDSVEYYEFYFEPGSLIIASRDVEVKDTTTYYIYNEMIGKARIPWYMDYEKDMPHLFDNAPVYAGVTIGASPSVMPMIISTLARNPKDLTQYYRHYLAELPPGTKPEPPVYVPFSSVIYGATNTIAKLGGNYFELGVISALNNPSVRRERVESILRQLPQPVEQQQFTS